MLRGRILTVLPSRFAPRQSAGIYAPDAAQLPASRAATWAKAVTPLAVGERGNLPEGGARQVHLRFRQRQIAGLDDALLPCTRQNLFQKGG